jgi:hypothetical protein
MKFLCLGYYDEKKFKALPKTEVDALVHKCKTHDEALRKSGHLLMVAALAPTRTASSVRPRNGKPSVTDGPFAETKEQIGAFFLIEAADLDEATRLASLHPAAHLGEHVGWGVEVRPIDFFQEP